MAHSHDCPHCGCKDTLRVHRKPLEHLKLGYRAFLCVGCNTRYLRFEPGKLLQWRSAA